MDRNTSRAPAEDHDAPVVFVVFVIVAAVMYLVEGPENGFTSIPLSMHWAVGTLATVGYRDLSPQTPLGQFTAMFVMLNGYGIIAVPTGIVTAAQPLRNLPAARRVPARRLAA